MPFSIIADLPLGTYRGHTSDGGIERIPSVARLHSALLCAAGFGPRAEMGETGLELSASDEAALRWLEHNPPDAVSIPALQVNRGTAVAYRDDGTLKRTRSTAAIKKLGKGADSSVAVDGRFIWTWSDSPPAPVLEVLEALCPDVPHLGTSETPVRLTSSRTPAASTHTLDPDAGLFAGSGEDIDIPVSGRVDELKAAHVASRGRAPSVRQDAVSADERSSSPVPPRTAARAARYTPVRAAPGEAPWAEALVVPLNRVIPEHQKVGWAVAAHRALIKTIGYGAPPILTGAYPKGHARPTNRLALHILDGAGAGRNSALVMLLPRNADEAELGSVLGGLRTLASIRGPGGAVAEFGHAEYRSGDHFWPVPTAGTIRLWRTTPPAIPDTRGHGADWTFAHAALLSLGFVWQSTSHLPRPAGRGAARYEAMVNAVHDAGVAVVAARPLHTSAVQNYVHRVHDDAVVRPYHVTLSVGSLGGDRTVQAIGQSRHLGGGLLVPVDIPEGDLVSVTVGTLAGDGS